MVGKPKADFLNGYSPAHDVIITNPPFSIRDDFLRKAYGLGKPFAFLLPLETLAGISRRPLFADNGIQLLIPDRRIDYIRADGKTSACHFPTAWFCWHLLPQPLIFGQ